MVQTLCSAIIALAIYFIFCNIDVLEPYAQYVMYAFWALLGVVVLVGIILSVVTIVRTVRGKKK